MTQLTLNNQQLLFVRVPTGLSPRVYFDDSDKEFLGTIQKSGDIVSTTIEDDVLEGLVEKNRDNRLGGKMFVDQSGGFNHIGEERFVEYMDYLNPDLMVCKTALLSFASRMKASGLDLKEGDKYAVLKVKK